jgi:YggT family protein
MDIILLPILQVLGVILRLYSFVVIAGVILTWLILFQIINPGQILVRAVANFCYRLSEPALRCIRAVVPMVGNFDFSPLILLLLLYFFDALIERAIYRVLLF